MTNPLKNFRKALETLDKHNAMDYHKQAVIKNGCISYSNDWSAIKYMGTAE